MEGVLREGERQRKTKVEKVDDKFRRDTATAVALVFHRRIDRIVTNCLRVPPTVLVCIPLYVLLVSDSVSLFSYVMLYGYLYSTSHRRLFRGR